MVRCREMLTRNYEMGRTENTQRMRIIVSWTKTGDKDEYAREEAKPEVCKAPSATATVQHLLQRRQKAKTTEERQMLVCTAAMLTMSHESMGAGVPVRKLAHSHSYETAGFACRSRSLDIFFF